MVFLSKPKQGPRAAFLAWMALLLCGAMAMPVTGAGAPLASGGSADMQASESRVKAAFVYKFGDYVEWPEAAFTRGDSPVIIGVVGAAPLAAELTRITSGRTISGRPVRVRALRHGEPLDGLHVLFIGRTDRRNMSEVLDASRDRPMLTITESDDGLALGSMINFVVVADKVRFDVAPDSAEAHRLKISSRLLAVARQVVEPGP